jgi:Domain of unknown function (DUF1906)
MIIKPAPFPALGFDCVTTLDTARATALKAAGMAFCLRYLGSITPAELTVIFDAGLVYMPVTFSRAPGWVPTTAMGTSDGTLDVQHLHTLAIPKGATVWVDLEGAAGSATAVAGWVNARAAVLRTAGYDVGLYVGAGDVLNGQQLFELATIDRYWKSLSDVPTPAKCGFAMIQLWKTVTVAGTEVDVDCIQYDYQDRLPMVVAAA